MLKQKEKPPKAWPPHKNVEIKDLYLSLEDIPDSLRIEVNGEPVGNFNFDVSGHCHINFCEKRIRILMDVDEQKK